VVFRLERVYVAQVIAMERERWTLWFTWFEQAERHTIRPQESCCIDVRSSS
jgi:hypothetical protein